MLSREPITAEDVARSPAWLPLEPAGGDTMRLVQLDEAGYRAASFLDQRLLAAGYPQSRCPVAVLVAAAAGLAPPASYIFHTGHVGSTLISRLIGSHPRLFALREPALLRSLAAPAAGGGGALTLEPALALLGRTWRTGQRAVVKATSFVSELAGSLLASNSAPTAILVFAQPPAYLQGIFAGPASRAETRQLAAARLERLRRRLAAPDLQVDPRSEGEWIAMSWACEMSALRQAADRFGSQVLWVDFDAFLAEPAATLAAIFRALGERPGAREIELLLRGPVMQQYSKAPEHAYDAALRRELLLEAEREHAVEIARGLHWLQQLARQNPLVQRLLR
jgi:hypothetical protein